MRGSFLVAGAVMVLAACGGEKKAEAPAAAAPEAAAPAPAPAADAPAMAAAPAPTGATIDVNMELVGSTYKYDPATITAKAGDVIKFHNKSGGPHNVAFDAAGIPSGSAAAVDAALGANKMGPLTGALLVEPNAVFTSRHGRASGRHIQLPLHAAPGARHEGCADDQLNGVNE